MIKKQNEANVKDDALIIYKFLVLYIDFENLIREIFQKSWDSINNQVKNRIAFYVGWLGSETRYIDYDSYSIKQEIHKYDDKTVVSKITFNQLIKIDRKERVIKALSFEVPSKTKKTLTYLSHDCFLALLNMRNKLAHEILSINFRNSDIIELLPQSVISNSALGWLKEIDVEKLSDQSKSIVSNYIYMKQIMDKLGREECNYEY